MALNVFIISLLTYLADVVSNIKIMLHCLVYVTAITLIFLSFIRLINISDYSSFDMLLITRLLKRAFIVLCIVVVLFVLTPSKDTLLTILDTYEIIVDSKVNPVCLGCQSV